jgi:DNA-binding SARP family transcriptional activator
MEFRVLGPVEVSSGGRPLQLGGAQQRALLAFLLLHANEVVSADRLLDELWAVSPGGGVAAVRTQVSRLRKQLGDRILTSGRGYELHIEPGELDLERFQALLAEAGTAAESGQRSALLRKADELWRGEALSGLDAPFVDGEAAALKELRLAALEARVEADLDAGRDGELVAELSALVARHPLRERLRGQLILALYRSGRQSDALEAYRETRRMLDEQLGLEPSPALRELERAILRHDPALAPAATPPTTPEPTPTRRGRRPTIIAAAMLAAICAVGASAALLVGGGNSKRPGDTVAAGPAAASMRAAAPAVAAPRTRPHSPHRARHTHTVVHRAPQPVVASTRTVKATTQPAITIVETTSSAPPSTHPVAANPGRTEKPKPLPPPPKPVTISDSFESDYVDPTIWHEITTGGDVSIAEESGQLQLTVGANAIPGGTYNQIDVHVGTQCAFPGNFDARVDYTLLEWPAGDNIVIGLNAIYANAAVTRESSSQWGDGYGSWVIPNDGSVALPDTSGSLRIARVNGVETTYFLHEGTWRKLASSAAGGAAVLGLQATSDGHNRFGGQEVKVAFDNFTVTGTNPTCAPGAQPS